VRSSNGEWTLRAAWEGWPDGKYANRLSRSGEEVWSEEFPVRFNRAAIADSGHVVATGGGPLDPQVWLIQPDGAARRVRNLASPEGREPGTTGKPEVLDLFIHDADRFTVRIGEYDPNERTLRPTHEEWMVFGLLDGELLARHLPRGEGADEQRFALDARPVQRTPLTVIQWPLGRDGTRFALLELDGSILWSLDSPDDLTLPARRKLDRADWIDLLRAHPMILPHREAPGFAVLLAKAGQRVDFEVSRNDDGSWRVEETSRGQSAYPGFEALPEWTLEAIGEPLTDRARIAAQEDGLLQYTLWAQADEDDVGFPQPGTGRRWHKRKSDRIELRDEAGKALATITALPDGRRINAIGALAAAPDGSLALLDVGTGTPFIYVATYDPDGRPLHTVSFTRKWIRGSKVRGFTIAHGGEWLAVDTWKGGFIFIRPATGEMHRWPGKDVPEVRSPVYGFTENCEEFTVCAYISQRLYRFSFPGKDR